MMLLLLFYFHKLLNLCIIEPLFIYLGVDTRTYHNDDRHTSIQPSTYVALVNKFQVETKQLQEFYFSLQVSKIRTPIHQNLKFYGGVYPKKVVVT